MPEALFMEKVNHPVVFELDAQDPDDDIWPKEEPASRGNGTIIILPSSRNPHEQPWTQETIHECIGICRKRGLIPGAIVAARPLLGSGNDWKVKSFVYWGVIESLNTFIPGQVYTAYAPISVRWIQPSNHNNRVVDKLFPADLYLIHAALTEETIQQKMKAQQEL